MKTSLAIFLSLFVAMASAQTTAGINPDHLWSNTSQTPANELQQLQPEVKEISLSTGVKLQYVEQGAPTGVPVIFLHGICDSWHSFKMVLRYLPGNIHAFSLTQRGHGDSEKPLSGYASTDFAADVAAFIRQKKLGSAVVVGHSMGGVHAQTFATRYPQLIRALVIVDSDPSFGTIPGMKSFQLEVMQLQGKISWEYMDAFQKACISRPIDSAFYRLLVDEGVKIPLYVFQAAMNGIVDTDFTGSLPNLQCPVLVFWGDKDAFCDRRGQEIFAQKIKKLTMKIYEGIGHSPNWQEPERMAKDITQFIQSFQLQKAKKHRP